LHDAAVMKAGVGPGSNVAKMTEKAGLEQRKKDDEKDKVPDHKRVWNKTEDPPKNVKKPTGPEPTHVDPPPDRTKKPGVTDVLPDVIGPIGAGVAVVGVVGAVAGGVEKGIEGAGALGPLGGTSAPGGAPPQSPAGGGGDGGKPKGGDGGDGGD